MSSLSMPVEARMDLLAQQKLFRQYVQSHHELSAYAFVNVFLWKDFFSFRFVVIEDQLCVFAENEVGRFQYLPPLGKRITAEAIEQCFKLMEEVNGGNGVSRIENVEEAQLPFFSKERFEIHLKSRDYCYPREDIVHLKGNLFKDKRNAYNAFIKHNQARWRPYDPSLQAPCLVLYEDWAQDRRAHHPDAVLDQMLDDNRIVHQVAMEFYKELGLVGRVVEVEGRVIGYTFGYPLNDEMFCVLFEVTDLKFKGLTAYVFREFCKDQALGNYRLINAMDDFAMPDLARTKMSYQPVKLVPSYTVTYKTGK